MLHENPLHPAQWIWMPEPGQGHKLNNFMLARRALFVDKPFRKALLHISADSTYRLHVNGTVAGYGPPLTDSAHIVYETLDVTTLLRPGANVLAAAVNTLLTGIGGLICRLDLETDSGVEPVLFTDTHWRTLCPAAWHRDTPPASLFWNFSEVLDLNAMPNRWDGPEFDDSNWQPAVPAPEPAPDPDHEHRDSTCTVRGRTLEPSPIPPLTVTECRPEHVPVVGQVLETEYAYRPAKRKGYDVAWKMLGEFVHPLSTCSVANAEALISGTGAPATVSSPVITRRDYQEWWNEHDDMPKVEQPTVILDFGLVAGRLRVDIDANSGATLDVAWGDQLIDGRVHPKTHPAWNVTKANRYTLREGRQTVEMFHWEIFRFVQITFRYLARPAQIHAISVKRIEYPLDHERYFFRCDDPEVQKPWQAWINTVRATTVSHFTDPREKGFWAIVPAGLLPLHGDVALVRHVLNTTIRATGSDFLVPASPLVDLLKIKSGASGGGWLYSVFRFAGNVTDYFWYGSDTDLFRDRLYPWLKGYARHLCSYTSGPGLIDDRKLPRGIETFVDWSRPESTAACNSNQTAVWNMKWIRLLRELSAIAAFMDEPDDRDAFAAHADELAGIVFDRFWSQQEGLYVEEILDGVQGAQFSEYANCQALLADLGGQGRADRIVAGLMGADPDLIRCEPLVLQEVVEAFFHVGLAAAAMQLLCDRLSRHFRTGNLLLGEEWSYFGSIRMGDRFIARIRNVAQGLECAFEPRIYCRHILGIKPMAPGMTEFAVQPQLGRLKDVEGRVASPNGDIRIGVTKTGVLYRTVLDVPTGARAHVFLPDGRGWTLNGAALTDIVQLEPGKARLGFTSVAVVGPGHHEIETRARAL